MALSRRRLLGLTAQAAMGLGAARLLGPFPKPAMADPAGGVPAAAMSAIDAYVERHLQEWGAPGLTLGLATRDVPGGIAGVRSYGWRDVKARTPLGAADLFQIGSITKSFVGIGLLQLQQEGKLDLARPVRDYLPWLRIESRYAPITAHHLLTHSAGLPNPLSLPATPLWTAYPPGERFHYCNAGYQILGFLLEEVDGRPLKEILRARIFQPLGMNASEAVISHDIRPRMPVSYWPLYDDRPFPRRGPLVEAPHLAMDNAAGCIASTPHDMALYMRMLLDRGRGPRGPVLSAESFARFVEPAVAAPAFGKDAGYGYGIAIVPLEGRTVLRHTGGMVSFSSAMHVDLDAGVAAFASVNARLGSYRPSAVASYALAVLRAARQGAELPPQPPPDDPYQVPNAADYAGTYTAPDGRRLVLAAPGERLELLHEGRRLALERAAPDVFLVQDPRYALFPLAFGRKGKDEGDSVVEVSHGGDWYAGERYRGPRTFETPSELRAYEGHYRNENPWEGSARVVLRKGRLWLGADPLVPLEPGLFRIGEEEHSPDRVRFEEVAGGRARRALFSGTEYLRIET